MRTLVVTRNMKHGEDLARHLGLDPQARTVVTLLSVDRARGYHCGLLVSDLSPSDWSGDLTAMITAGMTPDAR